MIEDLSADAAHLKKGKALYNTVITLSEKQKKQQQEESLAYDNYHELKSEGKAVAKRNFQLIQLGSPADGDLQNRLKIFTPKANGGINFYF